MARKKIQVEEGKKEVYEALVQELKIKCKSLSQTERIQVLVEFTSNYSDENFKYKGIVLMLDKLYTIIYDSNRSKTNFTEVDRIARKKCFELIFNEKGK